MVIWPWPIIIGYHRLFSHNDLAIVINPFSYGYILYIDDIYDMYDI